MPVDKTSPPSLSAAREYSAGKKVAGCYSLEKLLFETPFAVVWQAHDDLLARDVALHFLPDSVAADQKALSDIREQVRLNRQVLHPGIVRIYDLVEDIGCAAISMDLAEAQTVAEVMKQRDGGVFQPADIRPWLAQLLRIGSEAHEAQLIHRDLSPDTVLVRPNGDLLVSSFGLSRVVLDVLSRQQPNRRDSHLPYMSPQLLDGESSARTDDVYSFGALVFKLLTGKPPFYENDLIPQIRKTTPPTLQARREERKIAGEAIPPAWEKAIAACLAKHTDARPKTFKEVTTLMGLEGAASTASPIRPSTAAAVATGAATAGAIASKTPSTTPEPKTPTADGKSTAPAAAKSVPTGPAIAAAGSVAGSPAAADKAKFAPPPASKASEPTKADSVAEKTSEPGRHKSDAVIRETSNLRQEPAKIAEAEKAGSRISPFAPQNSGNEPAEPRRGGGGGLGIVLGLVFLALILIGVIYLLSRHEAEPGEPGNTESTEAAPGTAAARSTPAFEKTPPELVDLQPTPSATPEKSATSAPTTTPSPAPAEVEPSPSATPTLPDLSAITSMEDPEQLAPEELTRVIAQADALSQQLNDRQAELKQKTEEAKTAAAEQEKAITDTRKEVEKSEKAAAEVEKAQEKAAADAEAARKAAEESEAALKAQQQKAVAAKTAVDERNAALAAAEKKKEAAAQTVTEAAAELNEIQTLVSQAEKQQKRLASAREKLAKTNAAEEAARQQKLEEERAAAEARRLAAEKKRAELEERAAAAEKAAANAAALAEQARKALEEAERLRKASDEAREQADSAAADVDAAESPAPSPAASPTAAPSVSPTADLSPTPAAAAAAVLSARTNSLGMKFVQIGDVLFCVWPTRLQDYTKFAGATGRSEGRWREAGFEQGPDHPVVYVTWLDAIAFCQWLTEKEQASGDLPADQTYRLPTDQEWSQAVGLAEEKGASPEDRDMGIANAFPWGSEWPPPDNAGNYTGDETGSDVAIKGFSDGFVYTSPVGKFKVSSTGLYDLGGNVWEWCMDWWNGQQTSKVLRGASWYNGALKLSLLSSCRVRATPDSSTDNYGFRVIIGQIPKASASAGS